MVSISVISLSAMAQLGPKSDEFPIFLSKGILLAKNDAPSKKKIKTKVGNKYRVLLPRKIKN